MAARRRGGAVGAEAGGAGMMAPVRIAVFGATGGIGRLVVERLLARGDTVTALVRSPERLEVGRAGLTVHVGELTDTALVARTVAGADAVVSALGPSLERGVTGTPVVHGTVRIVEAMREAGVRRYVGLATPSVADPRDRLTLQGWLLPRLAALLVPRAVGEVRAISEVVRASGLDWTLVRITMLTDGDARGRTRSGYLGRDALGPRIARADVAAYLVEQIRDRTHVGACPAVGS